MKLHLPLPLSKEERLGAPFKSKGEFLRYSRGLNIDVLLP